MENTKDMVWLNHWAQCAHPTCRCLSIWNHQIALLLSYWNINLLLFMATNSRWIQSLIDKIIIMMIKIWQWLSFFHIFFPYFTIISLSSTVREARIYYPYFIIYNCICNYFLFTFIIVGLRYIMTFTNVLTIYHSWIYPFHYSLSPLLSFLE
jgi:hypothetical protein